MAHTQAKTIDFVQLKILQCKRKKKKITLVTNPRQAHKFQ